MESEHWLTAIIIFLIAVVLSILIVTIYLHNLSKPSDNELYIKMLDMGYSPAIVQCLDRNWSMVPEYEICSNVLLNSDLSVEEAKSLVDGLR